VSCTIPDITIWYATDVQVPCTASDASGLANPAGDASFTLATNVAAGTETSNALTSTRNICDTLNNCTLVGFTFKVDKKSPVVACGSADNAWHTADVSIACTASDSGSGLANPADASFSLSTSVASGTETNNASTNSRNVADAVGNSATAGPISGNKVDRKAPALTLDTPAATTYTLNQVVNASYSCDDGGSGVTTCAGPVVSGAAIDTGSVGRKSFAVRAIDAVGNETDATVAYVVAYGICLLYDPTKAKKVGSDYPIKLQLCDASGRNRSSADIVVTARSVALASNDAPGALQDSGNANPDNGFRYDPGLGTGGGYIYNLSTKGLSVGTYNLRFTVQGDPVTHTVQFQVR
jgi:hypothetical protein